MRTTSLEEILHTLGFGSLKQRFDAYTSPVRNDKQVRSRVISAICGGGL
jgi:hypothetical protein